MARPRAIKIHRSNRMENLVAALADEIESPLGHVLTPELLVVQSRGMALWLSQEISKRHGVATNLDFLYPKNFVQRVFSEVLGESLETYRFTREHLLWAISSELPSLLSDPSLTVLRDYLEGDRSGLRQIQLCQQIAKLFDQYLTYRPELIRSWETASPGASRSRSRNAKAESQLGLFAGTAHEAWQRKLWQRINRVLGERHIAALEGKLTTLLESEHVGLGQLPERVLVFGISTLPPLYLRILTSLARHLEVQLFLLSPCQHYWFDLPEHRARRGNQRIDASPVSHPLLVSLGRLGAEFAELLSVELERQAIYEAPTNVDLYQSSEPRTLLGRLQANLLDLDLTPANADPAGDGSIQIHSCHSPLREVEVLHDHLLDLLTQGTDLQAHQIVVMMPNVDTYAPFIEAVFSRPVADGSRIPYQIADRAVRHEGEVINAFLRILELGGTRLTASDVLDLLSLSAVSQQLALTPRDVELITDWITKSGVRWGIDAVQRQSFDQPPEPANTWVFGLERLLLGYAIEDSDADPYCGVLPFTDLGAGNAALLGKLLQFCDRLFRTLEDLSRPRPLADWQQMLVAVADDLLHLDDETAWQHRRIRQCLQDLVTSATEAGFDQPIAFSALRALLTTKLDEPLPAHGFISGGVTFCALVPMRSIPFRVVCLLGMGDTLFPRAERSVDFDLMTTAGNFRFGDPVRKADDRYLFLEALISARERLFIAYTGQSIRDNARIAPSIVVSELLDHLAALSGVAADPPAREAFLNDLVVSHPLQAFSPRYFDASDARLFSYEQGYLHGARSLLGSARPRAQFFSSVLPERERGAIDFADLVRFFERPTAHLFRSRLDIDLRESIVDIDDREPCELSPLDRFLLGETVLHLLLDGADDRRIETIARASGELPPGTLGASVLSDLLALAHPIAEAARAAGFDEATSALPIDLDLEGSRLLLELEHRPKGGLLRFRFGKLDARQLLGAWVTHVVANCELPMPSTLVGRSADDQVHQMRFVPLTSAKSMLLELVKLYELGQRAPLRFFPQASLVYAKHLHAKPDDTRGALKLANDQWKDLLKYDPHLIRLYGESSRLDASGPEGALELGPGFAELSAMVFKPLFEHCEDG